MVDSKTLFGMPEKQLIPAVQNRHQVDNMNK